ncbi:MAG: hypothetical protein LBS91_08000, partial [Clostridiales Family XIII bacterium]|nr:hypothetical protein [Clostridiales Family XIII bacterium]
MDYWNCNAHGLPRRYAPRNDGLFTQSDESCHGRTDEPSETTEKHGYLVRMIKLRNFGSAILHGCLFKRQERKACAVSSPIHFFGRFCAKNQLSAREVWEKLYF